MDEPKIMKFGNGLAIVLYSNAIIFPDCPEKKKEVEAILLDIMGIEEESANKEVLFNELKTKLVDETNKKEAEDKGTFLSDDNDVFVIISNRRTFFFPETENLNFGDWKLLRIW